MGDGWRGGAGYQFTFNNGVYIKAEYRYSDYDSGFTRHNVIGGVGYQF
jgi:outer membrane immunogenic protein